VAQSEWKKRRKELEHKPKQATKDNEDIKRAMGKLRDALDESERLARELEKQKAELRRLVEDMQQRLDRLQKSNKVSRAQTAQTPMKEQLTDLPKAISEERRLLQATRMQIINSQAQSPRSSINSTPSRSKVSYPFTSTRFCSLFPDDYTSSTNLLPKDPVYLKNVILQFFGQRDKKNQIQLIPVLGRILRFESRDGSAT
jgi:uncharacterized protein YhaN